MVSVLPDIIIIDQDPDIVINPTPVVKEEIKEEIKEYVTEEKIISLTGVKTLDQVSYLSMATIDSRESSLGSIGKLCPNILQLKFTSSIVPSIRDLGIFLGKLEILWLNDCQLKDLDGISSVPSLRELYVAFNQISTLSSLISLEHLVLVDLENNNISDAWELPFLSLCKKLTNLTLSGNPIQKELGSRYFEEITQAASNIKFLDDQAVEKSTFSKPKLNEATMYSTEIEEAKKLGNEVGIDLTSKQKQSRLNTKNKDIIFCGSPARVLFLQRQLFFLFKSLVCVILLSLCAMNIK